MLITLPHETGQRLISSTDDALRTPKRATHTATADETRGLRPANRTISSGQHSIVRVVSTPKAKAGVPDHKVPQGPRPPEFGGKRYGSRNPGWHVHVDMKLEYSATTQPLPPPHPVAPTFPMLLANLFSASLPAAKQPNIALLQLLVLAEQLLHHRAPTLCNNRPILSL